MSLSEPSDSGCSFHKWDLNATLLEFQFFLQLTQFPCYNQTSTIVIASLLNTFFFLCFFVDKFYLFEWVQKCPQTTKILSCREHFCFYRNQFFTLHRLLFKSDGGEENLFIGCACFSHSLECAKRKYCKRAEWQWHFLYFVCIYAKYLHVRFALFKKNYLCYHYFFYVSFLCDIRDISLPVTIIFFSLCLNFLILWYTDIKKKNMSWKR